MDFDFLPKLPNSNLDDRAYKDLVEECLLRIPRYCPEWTNHNPSDPGTTLIELFAWLTDQMQLRFNQVPRRNYVAFLELLGIRLDPPQPAHTEVTFYLTAAQEFPILIPQDTEVATERTATEEAIVFSTDTVLIIGNPRIRHFLTATTAALPRHNILQNPFANTAYERNQFWSTIEQTELFTEYQIGNCFYFVLDTISTSETQSLQGNVLEVTFRGEPATGTGIDPNEPPRVWQAWNGEQWQLILQQEADDRTRGFNFGGTAPGQPRLQEASVILHLPAHLPIAQFDTDYQGYWIRCVYQPTRQEDPELQPGYSTPPRVIGFSVRSIGGTIAASQCIRAQEELLGTSTGKPGQSFQLQMQPVLERQAGETIEVRIPGEAPESWQEVTDFSGSNAESCHYTIDSRQGVVQFGPLIREPGRLKQQTRDRAEIQAPFQPIIRQIHQQNGSQQNGAASTRSASLTCG
jgi:predicted phage baseplate assembly protein